MHQVLSIPSKPVLPQGSAGSWQMTLASIVVFALAFKLLLGADFIIIFFAVLILLIHEGGHLLAMKAFGYRNLRMIFLPLLGAVAIGTKSRIVMSERVLVLLSGPVPGILLGLGILWLVPSGTAHSWHEKMHVLGFMFVLLNCFNLLPVAPLDGGRLIEALFFTGSKWASPIFVILSAVGMILLIASQQSWYLLIIPFYLLLQLPAQLRTGSLRAAMKKDGVWISKSYEELSDEEYWAIRSYFLSRYPKAYRNASASDTAPAASEMQIARSVNNLLHMGLKPDMSQFTIGLTVAFWLFFLSVPLFLSIFLAARNLLD